MHCVRRAACHWWIILWRHTHIDIRGHGVRAIGNIEGKVYVAIEVFVRCEAVCAIAIVSKNTVRASVCDTFYR